MNCHFSNFRGEERWKENVKKGPKIEFPLKFNLVFLSIVNFYLKLSSDNKILSLIKKTWCICTFVNHFREANEQLVCALFQKNQLCCYSFLHGTSRSTPKIFIWLFIHLFEFIYLFVHLFLCLFDCTRIIFGKTGWCLKYFLKVLY